MAALDNYESQPTIMTYPARHLEAVTPHDTTELTNVSRALWIGGAGNITVLTAEDETVLISGIQAGTLLPIQVKRVDATATTATLITSLY